MEKDKGVYIMVKEGDVIKVRIKSEIKKFLVKELPNPEGRSDSFYLLNPDTKKLSGYFLKDAGATGGISKYGEKVKGRSSYLRQKHMMAKFNALKRLRINLEPVVGFYSDKRPCVVTQAVGKDLHECYLESRNNPIMKKYMEENAEKFFEQVCHIMGTLHKNKYSHEHPHNKNFTVHNHEIYLIDIGKLVRCRYLNWEVLSDADAYLYTSVLDFGGEFNYLRSTFTILCDFMPDLDTEEKINYKFLEGFFRIIDYYPIHYKSKYLVLEELSKRFLRKLGHGSKYCVYPLILNEGLKSDIIVSNPMLEWLHAKIREYRKKDPGFFPGSWY